MPVFGIVVRFVLPIIRYYLSALRPDGERGCAGVLADVLAEETAVGEPQAESNLLDGVVAVDEQAFRLLYGEAGYPLACCLAGALFAECGEVLGADVQLVGVPLHGLQRVVVAAQQVEEGAHCGVVAGLFGGGSLRLAGVPAACQPRLHNAHHLQRGGAGDRAAYLLPVAVLPAAHIHLQQMQIRREQFALHVVQCPYGVAVYILLFFNPLRFAAEAVVHDVAVESHAHAQDVALEIRRAHILPEDERRQAAHCIVRVHLVARVVDGNLHTAAPAVEETQPLAVLRVVCPE